MNRDAENTVNARPDPLGFLDNEAVTRALNTAQTTLGAARIGSLPGLSMPLFIFAAMSRFPAPFLVIVRDDETLNRLEFELGFLCDLYSADSARIAALPDYDVFEMDAPLAVEDRRRRRLNALGILYEEQPPGSGAVVIATPGGARRRTLDRRAWRAHTQTLAPGAKARPEDVMAALLRAGYERSRAIDRPGRAVLRGGVLDAWPAHADAPVRIEFYGNSVEEIRRFDPETQRSQQKIESVLLTPASEVIFPQETTNAPAPGIDYAPAAPEESPIQALVRQHENLVRKDHAELIRRNLYFDAGVLYPTVFGSHANPLRDGLFITVIFTDARQCAESWDKELENMTAWAGRRKFPDPQNLFGNIYEELTEDTSTLGKTLLLNSMPYGDGDAGALDMPVRMLPPLPLDLGEISRILQRETAQGRVAIISRYKKRLLGFLDDESIQGVSVVEGAVRGGFRLDTGPCSVFTDAEMFQARPEKKKAAVRRDPDRRPLAAPSDIEKGDFVVHVDHGVGKYHGIVTRTSPDGVTRDFFSISYARGDSLFVPIEQIDRIEKYIGAKAAPPKIYPLHSARWGTVKQKVRKKIEDMASTLYALYSEREQMKGYAFSEDNLFMQELEESFPFEETGDQLNAIETVKERMQQPRPMDHLVYGDVGYGKTEVAVRAAFKAALDRKQVALLAPTTILSQQHGRTFRERLARFPVTVEVLNRFRTAREKKDIVKRLASGEIDIVIGTHALLADGVRFKDLGLLIVDEEQRFGVKHKERLKMMKMAVDVLTLTATPIPRTLHMSLIGLRDVSLIETPPEDRKAVKTFVEEWNPNMLLSGVEREMSRGGQVFFVHNNIDSIPEVHAFLSRAFPDARIAVIHGRMPANHIELTMDAFMQGLHDILLSTTIIENGLDIPNVNTLIVNGAENFGLGQMYQLRGRVGRSFRQSYAYFFYSPYKELNENARKRLQALRDFADLGSGYRLAMKDLEIRGAGNLLGGEQHGFITEIGFNLYCKMLAESVDKVRGTVVPARPPAEVDLCVSAFIPDDFIEDTAARTDFYKRLVSSPDTRALDHIAGDIKDRFGPPPRPLRHFILQIRIKLLAERCNAAAVKTHPHSQFTDMTFHDPDALAAMRTVSWPADFHCELVYLPDRLRFMHEGKQPGQVLVSIHGFLQNAVQELFEKQQLS